MQTRTWTALVASTVLAAAIAGCGMQRVAPAPPPVVATTLDETPGRVVEQSVVSVAATVVKVDQKKRLVTLKNHAGEEFDIVVGEEVRNLPQVRRGDEVVATYYESTVITLKKPGEASPGVEAADIVGRAAPGEKPAATAGTKTTVVAKVVGLNKKKGTITLKGPKGKVVTVTAREPKRLEPVKIGDLIEVVYTEAVAISVEKPEKE